MAAALEEVARGLWWWALAHPEWTPDDLEAGRGWEQVVASYALATEGGLVLFDPLVEVWDALDGLVEEHGAPSILITIMWHVRSSREVLARYAGSSLWAHEPAREWVDERAPVTATFRPGDELPGGAEAIPMHRIEEVAFRIPVHDAVVIGDTILGHGDRAELCPPTWVRRRESFAPARAAVQRLLDTRPRLLLLTHGGPTDPATLRLDG